MAVAPPKTRLTNAAQFGNGGGLSPVHDLSGVTVKTRSTAEADAALIGLLTEVALFMPAVGVAAAASQFLSTAAGGTALIAGIVATFGIRRLFPKATPPEFSAKLRPDGLSVSGPDGVVFHPWADLRWADVDMSSVNVFTQSCELACEIPLVTRSSADRKWLAALINDTIDARGTQRTDGGSSESAIDARLAYIRTTARPDS